MRIVIEDFTPSASFRRLIRKNADLTGELCPPRTGREQYDLLRRYLDARHENGGMADMTPGDYVAMVEETAVDTFVTEYRTETANCSPVSWATVCRTVYLVYSFLTRAQKPVLGVS